MAKIELNNDQLRLIQKVLDFYSRVGQGNFNEIIEHPTFEKSLHRQFSPNKPFEVGDRTMRGEIVEIDKKGKWIKTKGSWGNGEEVKKWTDLENIMYSPDWEALYAIEENIKRQLNYSGVKTFFLSVNAHKIGTGFCLFKTGFTLFKTGFCL